VTNTEKSASLAMNVATSVGLNGTATQQMIGANTSIGALFNNVEDITRAINNLNNLVNAMGSVDN
jgi:hypothetical protein